MRPEEGCKLCKSLRERFPEGDLDPDELLEKHFPDAKMIKKDGGSNE